MLVPHPNTTTEYLSLLCQDSHWPGEDSGKSFPYSAKTLCLLVILFQAADRYHRRNTQAVAKCDVQIIYPKPNCILQPPKRLPALLQYPFRWSSCFLDCPIRIYSPHRSQRDICKREILMSLLAPRAPDDIWNKRRIPYHWLDGPRDHLCSTI